MTNPMRCLFVWAAVFIFFLPLGLAAQSTAVAPLVINAGNDRTICPGTTTTIGGSPTVISGTPPYTYSWSPGNGLSATNVSNPIASPTTSPQAYILTVTDADTTVRDTMFVLLDPIWMYNAGPDTDICIGESVQLGDPDNSMFGGVNYSWTPTATLDNPSAPRPVATPTNSTYYTVTITSATCPTKVFHAQVNVHPLPIPDAGPDVTINEGETTTLQASGGSTYFWFPTVAMRYAYSANPDVEPILDQTYFVGVVDEWGCTSYDSVRVFVNPSDVVVIYNTFTPNSDGDNDTWYIGNIQKYPNCRLSIYNRYGQEVYSKTGYQNDWNGTNFGERLPEATYYYLLDLGPEGKGEKLHGSVTIVR